MVILYINDEHCSSVEQLKGFLNNEIKYGSPLFMDLVDYGRAGELAQWLIEQGETELAKDVDSINQTIGDSEYVSLLASAILGEKKFGELHNDIIKPHFSDCFNIEDVHAERSEEKTSIIVVLKAKMIVNETFEFGIQTIWGRRAVNINSKDSVVGEILSLKFTYRNRPNSSLKEVLVMANDNILRQENFNSSSSAIEIIKANTKEFDDNKVFTLDNIHFNMILVKSGNFEMGWYHSGSIQDVSITYDYYIGEFPVTQGLWNYVMERIKVDSDFPKTGVCWKDWHIFISRLNRMLKNELNGMEFRMPTEAEWEYAARGGKLGKNKKYPGSDDLDEVAWCWRNSDWHTHAVGKKEPNELGLYDMFGNVGECCLDSHIGRHCNFEQQVNPICLDNSEYIITRGGGYTISHSLENERVGVPKNYAPEDLGLRLCLSSYKYKYED